MVDPPQPSEPEKALSTGTSPPNVSAPVASISQDAKSAPSSRTATVTRVPTTGRIRHGLLSRAGSEAEDRSHKAESPINLTSEDEDHRISDSAALPRRFPSTSSSRVASIRGASTHSLVPSPWSPSHEPGRANDPLRDPYANTNDSGSSLGRAKSISSVSSVNSTSSLEAAPFREAPLGNVRVGFGGISGNRASRLAFTHFSPPQPQQQSSRTPGSTSPLAIEPGPPAAGLPPEPKGPSDRHKGVPKNNNNAWLYRNAPGMRGSRLRPSSNVDAGDADEDPIDPGQATPGKRTRDALRLKIAKSASKLGLKTASMQTQSTSPFGDSVGDPSFVGSIQPSRASSSSEENVAMVPGSRSPLSTRASFFSSGPHSPRMLSTPGPSSSFSSTPTELLVKTSTVTNAPMVVSKYTGLAPKAESGSPLHEVLEGLSRLPGPKLSPRAEEDGHAPQDPLAKQVEESQVNIQRPPLLRADSSSNSQDMPAVPGLALAESAADVSTSSTLRPPPRSVRRDSQVSTASRDGTPQPPPRSPVKPSTRCPTDFHFGETLGEGSYSTVLEGWDLLSGPDPKEPGALDPHAISAAAAMVGAGQKRGRGQVDLTGKKVYAVKVLDKVHILKQGKQKYVTVEKEALSRLIKFPGVVTLFWTFQDRESLYFVLELAANGELLSFIRKYGSFDEHCARFYAAMLAETIRAMHEVGVIHRDLKPENVLLDANMRIKVTDFGSAKLLSLDSTEASNSTQSAAAQTRNRAASFVGTAEYVSPELLADTVQPAGKASDWWAFGCVVFQMITGRPPFKGVNEYQTLQKVKHRDFAFPNGFPEDARDLVDRLLVLDPQARLSAVDVLAHPYFSSIEFATLWEQPVPAVKTGITEPVKQVSRASSLRSRSRSRSRSEMSFDESFVSEQSPGPDQGAQSSQDAASSCGDDSRRQRSDDADDSDLSDGTSDADSDIPIEAPQPPSAPQRRSSGLLRIMDGLTTKSSAGSEQPSPRSPSGSGLSMFGSLTAPMPRRRISTMSIETASRKSRDQASESVGSRYSRESRSPMRSSAQLSPAPTPRGAPGILSWNALLLPHELMLYSCPVIQKKTGTGKIFSKRRQLILTNFPRLLCVKETPDVLKVKSEVILGIAIDTPVQESFLRVHGRGEASSAAATTTTMTTTTTTTTTTTAEEPFPLVHAGVSSGQTDFKEKVSLAGPNLLTAVEFKGGKSFTVRTSSKAFIYEVFSGDAATVVKGIREASRHL
ncbi:uncharacterized protein PFL1_01729 [Pseudozyma flocculosa PF-1]|uniref:uncharacterized protein n=1 Tax=Pseudozyma flocculosa PF-1 TaxID=1277687 RepID=UPI0004560E90|nr:uncharacterized protein PFL1_01729 [Pseudozyma flocculosa PF-1]EPQ30831.1 hypothetical protein PFL1_01729 [Pseudozyma flocculosa PF-1]